MVNTLAIMCMALNEALFRTYVFPPDHKYNHFEKFFLKALAKTDE